MLNQQNDNNSASTSLKLVRSRRKTEPTSPRGEEKERGLMVGARRKFLSPRDSLDSSALEVEETASFDEKEKDKDGKSKLSPREEEEMLIIREMYEGKKQHLHDLGWKQSTQET